MRQWLTLTMLFFALSPAAIAGEATQNVPDGSPTRGAWGAVGRIDIEGSGFCTGALIAPDLVLTAAHCLFDCSTGARISPHRIEFRAGWRNGRASAHSRVRRAVVHPWYRSGRQIGADRVRNDLALLELHIPIRDFTVHPFETGEQPRTGDSVGVVSYARGRPDVASMQDICKVIDRQRGVLVTTCSADFGSSGAPIFDFSGSEVRIVSVISAKARANGQDVSLGAPLAGPLRLLRAQLIAGSAHGVEVNSVERPTRGSSRTDAGVGVVNP